jgi:hypothetical protein
MQTQRRNSNNVFIGYHSLVNDLWRLDGIEGLKIENW